MRINLFNRNNLGRKALIVVFLCLANGVFGNAQDSDAMERKQLFDYDWMFSLGDVSEAKANNYNDQS